MHHLHTYMALLRYIEDQYMINVRERLYYPEVECESKGKFYTKDESEVIDFVVMILENPAGTITTQLVSPKTPTDSTDIYMKHWIDTPQDQLVGKAQRGTAND